MRSTFLNGLLLGAFISLLGLNPAIAAARSVTVAAYVKAGFENGSTRGDIIELVRETAAREGTEQTTPGMGKRKNGERGTEEPGRRRGTESESPKPGEREAPESPVPGTEEPSMPEEIPEETPEPEIDPRDVE
jgi:hypothetical protein